jgi:hypothetical protein
VAFFAEADFQQLRDRPLVIDDQQMRHRVKPSPPGSPDP